MLECICYNLTIFRCTNIATLDNCPWRLLPQRQPPLVTILHCDNFSVKLGGPRKEAGGWSWLRLCFSSMRETAAAHGSHHSTSITQEFNVIKVFLNSTLECIRYKLVLHLHIQHCLKGNCGGGVKFTWMVVDIRPEFPHIQFLEKLCFYVLIILPN